MCSFWETHTLSANQVSPTIPVSLGLGLKTLESKHTASDWPFIVFVDFFALPSKVVIPKKTLMCRIGVVQSLHPDDTNHSCKNTQDHTQQSMVESAWGFRMYIID